MALVGPPGRRYGSGGADGGSSRTPTNVGVGCRRAMGYVRGVWVPCSRCCECVIASIVVAFLLVKFTCHGYGDAFSFLVIFTLQCTVGVEK